MKGGGEERGMMTSEHRGPRAGGAVKLRQEERLRQMGRRMQGKGSINCGI